jgi:hypothetical protein
MVEFFSDIGRFLNVVVDTPFEVLCDIIFACEFAENFEVFAFLNILRSDIADEGTDAVDIVGETNTGDHFDEGQDHRLLVCCSSEVSKPDSEHHSGGPVIGPCVFLKPRRKVNIFVVHPVLLFVNTGHGNQENGHDMCKTEVKQKNLDQVPVLFIVKVVNKKYLQFLYFLQALAQFYDDEQPEVYGDSEICKQVQDEDKHADKIDWKVVFEVVTPNLSERPQSLTLLKLNRKKIYPNLNQVKRQTERLESLHHRVFIHLIEHNTQRVNYRKYDDL